MNQSLTYYLNDYWTENGDPLTSTFPGMSNPWFFFFLGLYLILLIKYGLPFMMESRKAFDIKPAAIILSGFAFGTTSCGLVILLAFTPILSMTMDCNSYKPITEDLNDIVLKYIAYCFVFCKLYDFINPILSVLGKRETQVSNLYLIQLQSILMFSWLSAKLNPGGLCITLGIVDTLYQVLVYGYLVMSGSSDEIKPGLGTRIKIKNMIRSFRHYTAFLLLPYSLYFVPKNDCPNSSLRFCAFLYLVLYAAFFPIDIRRRQLIENEKYRMDKIN